jgi:hypothetical protein
MSNWLKAGLIGAAVVFVLNLLAFIPCVGCFTVIPALVTFGCVGALAAYWMPPVRMAGPAAGYGALAGLITGVVDALMGIFVAVVSGLFWGSVSGLSQLPPEAILELHRAGIDPVLLQIGSSVAVATTCSTMCGAIFLLIAVGLGALGGLIFASVKPE